MAEAIKKATRESFGMALAELGDTHPELVVLDADLAKATQTLLFKQKHPERFFDCGIAEGNMIGVAAGLAAAGKVPVAATFAMFSAGRAYEQIRNSVGYPHLNVKVVGTHAGVSVGEDGASHQCLEDLALMRAVPGMVVLCPADHYETVAAVKAMIDYQGPVYLRLGRLPVESVYHNYPDMPFTIGKGNTLRQGGDVALIATGLEVYEALQAAELLAGEGIQATVIDIHTLKPLDAELVTEAARATGAVVTAEEHSRIGGLGDAVGAALLDAGCAAAFERVAVNDIFGHSGKGMELVDEFGLRAKDIAAAAKRAIARK
ncbi:MAG TPA: transketolase family protein [Candidatus Intestinimonas pullistercoris]|uniref:Transketolase family protein n=1 Tax=Candidatus Intestinimonas pullistercoris TaxID=2838623 RepID=A0A9D2P030_9FIRM|nr:transketolase C-terminal domain-containing protein [uncultured Intestinimonas sp.]HJC41590.1 transketolase family protein [Candidatus Intestinimonas pullistercoris]